MAAHNLPATVVEPSVATRPAGSHSAAWLATPFAIALNAAASSRVTVASPAALARMRVISARWRSLRRACDAVVGAGGAGAPGSSSFSEPSTMPSGAAAADSKKACTAGHTRGSTSSTCASAFGLIAEIRGQKTASQMSAMARTPAMHGGERAPVRIDFLSLPPPAAARSSSSSR